MSEFGIKIQNIQAATLYEFNKGLRESYDSKEAMFCNSLFSKFIIKNGMKVHKGTSTRDIICVDFGFGTRDYETEKTHLINLIEDSDDDVKTMRLQELLQELEQHKDEYIKYNKEEIRNYFYENDLPITYTHTDKKTGETISETIIYTMMYRNASKAKMGQVMFINKELYPIAQEWITMGLASKLPENEAKIVELSAYAPLITSTIVGDIEINIDDVLILEDQDSFFTTIADVITAEEYVVPQKIKVFDLNYDSNKKHNTHKEIKKKCVVNRKETEVKNVLWDGLCLIESDILPSWINGMALLRNHFFKACGLRTHIQKFFKDWCESKSYDYETYTIKDMFGISHKLKDIKIITTNNAIKWLKFIDLMGGTKLKAYKYWRKRIKKDGCVWGIVKTDHESKLGDVQQMSYQMVNTLPCTKEQLFDIAKTSIDYVEKLKTDFNEFEKFLRKNKNEVNHYEMLADMYKYIPKIDQSAYFRSEKKKIISTYVHKLRKGKIILNGDNLTMFGNPYALLLYSVGENFMDDPTLKPEQGVIQCYTPRFEDGEYLCGFRSPHNSPNNVGYFKNVYSEEFKKYFKFSKNIIAVNCIKTDVQARLNGCDFDLTDWVGSRETLFKK